MKHDKQSFVENLFAGTDFKIINGVALLKLTSKITVKVSLTDIGYKDHYSGLLVRIINNEIGVLDKTIFKFDDHLTHAQSNHPNANPKDGLYVWNHRGWDWYINRPTERSINRMLLKVIEYTETFI